MPSDAAAGDSRTTINAAAATEPTDAGAARCRRTPLFTMLIHLAEIRHATLRYTHTASDARSRPSTSRVPRTHLSPLPDAAVERRNDRHSHAAEQTRGATPATRARWRARRARV